MNKNYIALSLAGLFGLGIITTNAQAELTLPSGADRRPNLSLDPFERAREAMRKLPASKPTEEPKREAEVKEAAQESTAEVAGKTEAATESQAASPVAIKESGDAFSYEFAVTADAFSLTSGGLIEDPEDPNNADFVPKKTGVVGVVDFVAEFDTAAAGLWDNGLFFLYSALTFGTGPDVGDLHGISNINAGGNTMRIVELWYEHSFPYSHSSIIFGMHDFNGEFYVSEYAGLFINAGFGMGQVIGENGGPSGYPLTTLGVRLKSEVTENSYFQIAMYDGAASDEEFNQILAPKLDKNEGVFVGAEGGIFKNEPGDPNGYYKIAAGFWYLRAEQYGFDTIVLDTNGDPKPVLADNPKPGTSGVYFFAETSIGEKMGLFFKYGKGRQEYIQHSQFMAAGLNFTGAIPGRDEDVLGLAALRTNNSPAYLAQLDDANIEYKAETVIELTYTAQITDWLMVQPDYQYIQNPSMDQNIVKSSVIGVRAQAVF